MKHSHVLFVCTSCGSSHKTKQYVAKSGGERLLEKLKSLHRNWALQDEFSIQQVECMDVCDQACAIAFASPHKHTYLFGRLPADAESVDTTAAAVLSGASQYHSKSTGLLPYSRRPELLRTGTIARIPPVLTAESSEPTEFQEGFSPFDKL
jgi:predicted metal-binding protein